jgi:hypothetical protein
MFLKKMSFLSSLFLALIVVGCTSSEQDSEINPEEPVAGEESGEDGDSSSEAEAKPTSAEAPPPVESVPLPEPESEPEKTAPIYEEKVTNGSMDPASDGAGTRRVLYVKVNGVKIYDSPNTAGKVVDRLNKGDHILVDIEGEWAKLGENQYVQMKSLSMRGIGKKKSKATWKK